MSRGAGMLDPKTGINVNSIESSARFQARQPNVLKTGAVGQKVYRESPLGIKLSGQIGVET